MLSPAPPDSALMNRLFLYQRAMSTKPLRIHSRGHGGGEWRRLSVGTEGKTGHLKFLTLISVDTGFNL